MQFIRLDQRAKPKTWRRDAIKQGARCEIKLDGHRLTIVKESGRIWSVSRKVMIDNWYQVLHCIDTSVIDALPDNTVLDGELHGPSNSTDVVSLIKKREALTFSPFSIPVIDGVDIRFKSWQVQDHAFKTLNLKPPARWYDFHTFTPEEILDKARSFGIEGWVIKEQPYAGWWKVKPEETIDCFVTEVIPGKGRMKGRHGALVIGVFDGHESRMLGKVGTGRDELWRDVDPDFALSTVVEVGYEGFTSGGQLRFPRFIRWREDKDITQCTLPENV